MSEWISFNDKRPPRKPVILYFPATSLGAHRSNALSEMIRVDLASGCGHRQPTHWMPLPEAPAQTRQEPK